ncbi:DUF4367 domain-containing protein [Caproiciproducens sp. R1]|uniref:DUF4367 domain-containing protein n=1 Tax=Caproiciproducens sp. R1 TaxID=3435000 RepID=UPI004033E657
MTRSKLHCKLFNDMLKAAVEENLMESLDAIPSEEELKKEYSLSEEFHQKILKIAKKQSRKSLFLRSSRITKKVAVFVAMGILISFGSLFSVEASRNFIFNSILDWKADHVDIYFQEKNSSSSEGQVSNLGGRLFNLQYLPAGFTETKETEIGPRYRITYQNEKNESIFFDQAPLSEEGKMMVDTEHTVYKEISINGQKASLFTARAAGDKTFVLWQNDETSLMISSTISQDELIKMAENAAIKKN